MLRLKLGLVLQTFFVLSSPLLVSLLLATLLFLPGEAPFLALAEASAAHARFLVAVADLYPDPKVPGLSSAALRFFQCCQRGPEHPNDGRSQQAIMVILVDQHEYLAHGMIPNSGPHQSSHCWSTKPHSCSMTWWSTRITASSLVP